MQKVLLDFTMKERSQYYRDEIGNSRGSEFVLSRRIDA